MKYGKLTVIKEVPKLILPSGQKNRAFLCKCECGNEKIVRKVHLDNNKIKSCGCLVKTMNGKGNDPIMILFRSMRTRTKSNYFQRHLYYDKGICVCNEWMKNPHEFYKWAKNNGYKKGLQIDRIDSNKGYNPKNCRFVTAKENTNNRVNTFFVKYKDNKYAFTDLLDKKKLNLNEGVIRGRLRRGWSVEDAFDKPIRLLKLTK
jgi:hypothetical protein